MRKDAMIATETVPDRARRMLHGRLLLARERLDAHFARRSHAHGGEPDEGALRRHSADFRESDPSLRQQRFDRTRDPGRNLGYYRELRDRLSALGVRVDEARVEPGAFASWLDEFALLGRYYRLFGDIRVEKCLEHFLVGRELDLARGDTYIDMASAGSPWARLLRMRGVRAHRLDLIYRPGVHGVNIGGDATATGLPDGIARGISAQCAFELFHGDGDRRFVEEIGRLLAPGGRAVITPLYLDERHFVLQSPQALPPAGADEPGALRVWREDTARAPFSRHYSPEAFVERIASRLPFGLSGRVVYTRNLEELMAEHPDQRLYAFFTLVLEKYRA